jgi:hypothetical protein
MSMNAQLRIGSHPADQGGEAPPVQAESEESRLLKHEVARYIAQMTTELGGMARGADMDLLAYFLDMCRVEAHVQLDRYDA